MLARRFRRRAFSAASDASTPSARPRNRLGAIYAAAILRRRSLLCPFFPAPKELRFTTEDPLHRGDNTILKLYRGKFCRTVAHQIAGRDPSSALMSNAWRLSSSYSGDT